MDFAQRLKEARRIRAVDVVVAVGLFVASLLTLDAIISSVPAELAQEIRPPDALGYIFIGLQSLPLIWRQQLPRIVFLLVLCGWFWSNGMGYISSVASLGLIVAIHALGAFLPRRQSVLWASIAFVISVSWTYVGSTQYELLGLFEVGGVGVGVIAAWAMGRADATKRDRLTELELEQQNREVLNRESAEAAVRTERVRIARELHDVVAHEITVMTLQAEGARRQSGDTNPHVSEALNTISESGRKGLAEMQRMIGVLRDTSETQTSGDDPEVGTPHVHAYAHQAHLHDLTPVPALSALPALAKQVEDSGLPVELHITGGAHVPAGVELSAYRIVQESLTNALKHAGPGAKARVSVKRAKNAVAVTVEDDGRGVISDAKPTSGGHGLAGMRERVLALGGSIEFGPRPGGGFRVRANLPSHDDTVTPGRKNARAR